MEKKEELERKEGLEGLLDSSLNQQEKKRKEGNSFFKRITRNLTFLVSLGALVTACGDKPNKDYCEYNSDCPGEKICLEGKCVSPVSSSPDDSSPPEPNEKNQKEVIIKSGKTNDQGEVYFTDEQTGEEVIVKVTDVSSGEPVSSLLVNFFDGTKFEAFYVLDLQDNYYPELKIFPHNSNHYIGVIPIPGYQPTPPWTVKEVSGPPVEEFVDWNKKQCDAVVYLTKEQIESRSKYELMLLGPLLSSLAPSVYKVLSFLKEGVSLGEDVGLLEIPSCWEDCWYFWEPGEESIHPPIRITVPVDPSYCQKEECSSEEYQCADGKCIPQSYLCDGEKDCAGGEDEENCSLPTTTYCEEYGQCCPGKDDECYTTEGCYCDEYCVTAEDCCPDACSYCGWCE